MVWVTGLALTCHRPSSRTRARGPAFEGLGIQARWYLSMLPVKPRRGKENQTGVDAVEEFASLDAEPQD